MLYAFQHSHILCMHVGKINVNTIQAHCP